MTENSDYQQLTKGALAHMLEGTRIECPIVQILAYKNMKVTCEKRYRLILSDGAYSYQCCVILGELTALIEENVCQQYDLLKVLDYTLASSKNRQVIVLTNLQLVKKGAEVGGRIGNPVAVGAEGAPPLSDFPPNYHLNVQSDSMDADLENLSLDQIDWKPAAEAKPEAQPQTSASGQNRSAIKREHSIDSKLARPICALNQYMGAKWIIKGRCVAKINKRHWENKRSSGTFFTFILADSDCSIELSAFREECDKFFDMISVDAIYLVSNGSIKPKKRDSQAKAEYCIVLSADTVIELCHDENGCPEIAYNFKKIDQLDKVGVVCDLVAIVKSVGCVETVESRTKKELLTRRRLTVFDDTEKEISLTLWGTTATDFAGKEGDVIAGRRLQVNEFDGLCLSTTINSHFKVNPDCVRTHQLKAWYACVKNNLTTTAPVRKEVDSFSVSWKNLDCISLKNVQNRSITFQTKAVISLTGKTTFYLGCKTCNKMLVNCSNGLFRCNKCDTESKEFNYRIILMFRISDHTQSVWVQAFQAESLKLLGKDANLGELYDRYKNQPGEFDDYIRSFNHMTFIFLLKSSWRLYNDEPQISTQVMGIHEIKHREYGQMLLKQLKRP